MLFMVGERRTKICKKITLMIHSKSVGQVFSDWI